MLTIVRYENLWGNKVSVRFLQQLNVKNENKTGTIILIRH